MAAASKGKDAVELSNRERDVLVGIALDKTYPAIAIDLQLSFETVRTYAKRLRAKLGINTKTGLAIWAIQNLKWPRGKRAS